MKKVLVALLMISVCVAGCKKDDEDDKDNSSMSCKVDGVQWTAKSFNNTLVIGYDANIGADGKRLDVRGTDDNGHQIILSLADAVDVSNECVRTRSYDAVISVADNESDCITVDGQTVCSGALFTYMINLSTFYTGAYEGDLTITSCDAANKTVSGTFEFVASTFDDDTIRVTDGTFTNMEYRIIQ